MIARKWLHTPRENSGQIDNIYLYMVEQHLICVRWPQIAGVFVLMWLDKQLDIMLIYNTTIRGHQHGRRFHLLQ